MARLKNKVVIVTGGASGVGRDAALLFASEGARVAIADVDESGGRSAGASVVWSSAISLYLLSWSRGVTSRLGARRRGRGP